MNRRHVGAEQRVARVVHFLRILDAVKRGVADHTVFVLLFLRVDRGDQRTDADTCRAEVVYLVDLQQRIDLIRGDQDVVYLVGRDRVQTASERVQLDQVQIVARADIARGGIQTRVVHPLVENDGGAVDIAQMRDRVFGKHRKSVRVQHFRNAVVDLGVNVIRPSGQHDAVLSVLLEEAQDFLAFRLYVFTHLMHLGPGCVGSLADLLRGRRGNVVGNAQLLLRVVFRKDRDQTVRSDLRTRKGEERVQEGDVGRRERLDIVPDVLRIGRNDRAVIVVRGLLDLLVLVRNAGIEDEFAAFLQQPFDMTVRELRGVALGFGRDRLDAEFIDLMRSGRREHDAVAELPEEDRPERIVLIHVQHARNAHGAAESLLLGKRFVVEDPLHLIIVKVRKIFLILHAADALFAAVARDIAAAVREAVDREQAVVIAALAAGKRRVKGQILDLFESEHRGLLTLVIIPGDQGGAERAHDAGDIRTRRLTA